MRQHAFVLIALVAHSLCFSTGLAAQDRAQKAAQQFQQRLGRHITVAWQDQQLGEILARLSETQKITIWLDRRVDPLQRVKASFTDLPLNVVFQQLAEKHSLGMSVLENLLYIGPVQSAHELATLRKRAQDSLVNASPAIKRQWQQKETATWPRLSQPRELLTDMLEHAGVTLLNSEAIPHDLWASKQLPSLSQVDKTVLLLIGFDLTCQISQGAKSCQIVPIERPVFIKRVYRLSNKQKRLLPELQLIAPKALFEIKGRTLNVTSRWEDQQKVQQALSGRRPKAPRVASTPSSKTEKLFSLRLKNQAVGGVINQLAHQLKLQVEWDHKSLDKDNRSQQTLVSCDLKNVPFDELLSGILTPAGLRFQRIGDKIKIISAP